ncbi:hypothetical protein NW754_012177 [Fusarium falciforme]|uniref:Major facilitator superfamily (MFS) profile domain-containing protein n=1 Tax=Fusarium falciforme TaxID=195108 RepID=A0A9W8R2W6_9HYPO|nr:Hypothetical protein NCS54_00030900 [Fusarium falciforme]KAJ4173167.1 hypothetical protein NW754_012177 [Fusarium falciforme]KAJ4186137.1 hypothetical protein NW755_007988 [Fusarium falciforme]KAJ4203966.1 hypothetical protein NW767_004827 [Fusarium falciforme]KAJ4254171.1 hypothetical protein NW757_005317 [Fusarium falciforme]WAO83128.1 Hypothetical protein NCS54_00030900 [Fusarium falciforme]
MFKKYFGLKGQVLNYAISTIAGCDFLLFGYDQGVMGGILTMQPFLEQFPDINKDEEGISSALAKNRSNYQGIAVSSYNLGCFIGAIITIFIGNWLGRRKMIMLGTSIMVVGAALQASAFSLDHFIIGRIITGLGNGGNTSTVPMWQSETCSAHKRGKLVMIEGALITLGIMISYWVDYGMYFASDTSACWRFPLAFQIAFCLFIMAFVMNLPESPRWLMLKGRDEEAREVIAAIADRELHDKYVENEFKAIKETTMEMSKGSFSDLFQRNHNRNLHRTLIAYVNQMFQQISGINLITYYAATIYADLGMKGHMPLLLAALNGTEYFIASLPAIWLVERVGRRKLMLFGAAGQAITMAILAGVGSSDARGCQIAGIVFLFVFNSFFAVGWLGMTWLYPAEITPLRIRAPANALATSSNWIFNWLVVMITPPAFQNIKSNTYIIFAVINAIMFPSVYFFFPETAYRSLEEMDTIFQKVKGLRGALDVVHQAKIEPRRYDNNGNLLIAVEEVEEKGHTEHRSGSSSGASNNGPANATMFTSTDEENQRQEK